MRWVQKSGVKLVRLRFGLADPVEKVKFFDWIGSASRNSQSKKLFNKARFRLQDLGFNGKRPFSTDKFDCMKNGLSVGSRFGHISLRWTNWAITLVSIF